MKLVVIESPYHVHEPEGSLKWQLQECHADYLNACMADCFARGEAPFASHGLYPRVLDDDDPAQRRQGIDAGLAWGDKAELRAVYQDLGITPGMLEGVKRAAELGQTVEYRTIKDWMDMLPGMETNKLAP